ncbi:MAG: quinone oxidoreductase family protein [Solirubrobacteraceae bacterium]
MRAIQIRSFGGPEALELVELSQPVPGQEEVLIAVTRAGVNFADIHAAANTYVRKATLPLVPGAEVAGVRTDTGERVVALTGSGGYAEYALAPARLAFPIPDGLDDATALATLIAGLTAWHLHATAGRLAAGESVVVHSAAGGVGSLAVQLARRFDAGRVIATASSESKRALALELGADVALSGEPDGLTQRLLDANEGEPVDVVLDMAGGPVFDASYEALAHFGRIVVCGIASRQPNRIPTGSLLKHSRTIAGFYLFHCLERRRLLQEPLRALFAMAAAGELRVLLGGTYPLGEAGSAHREMAERRSAGKLLLDPTR